jgi:hypothetical protein
MGLAVVPAGVVSVIVASAGLMFVRFGVTGEFGDTFPGENDDVAAWPGHVPVLRPGMSPTRGRVGRGF